MIRARRLVTLVALAALGRQSRAQRSADSNAAILKRLDSIPEFYRLTSPASPAFVLLGVSPTDVERPATPRAVALSLVHNFTHGAQLAVPENAAIDIAPYWLVSHPRLTWGELQKPVSPFTWLRTFSISLASAESSFKTAGATPTDTAINRIAFGFRSVLIQGTSAAMPCVRQLQVKLRQLSTLQARAVAQYLSRPRADTTKLDSVSAAAGSEVRPGIDSLTKGCQKVLNVRQGFNLSVAGAVVGRFPGQSFDAGRVSSWGFWVTPMYATRSLTMVGVVRGLKQDGTRRLSTSAIDLGGRVVAAWDIYAFDLEQLWRHTSDAGTTSERYRTAGGFHLKVTNSMWVNATFGRDFGAGNFHPLVALAGLQWNLGESTAQDPAAFYGQSTGR
jgi:hypothetical protein